jgi:hypothetical protein
MPSENPNENQRLLAKPSKSENNKPEVFDGNALIPQNNSGPGDLVSVSLSADEIKQDAAGNVVPAVVKEQNTDTPQSQEDKSKPKNLQNNDAANPALVLQRQHFRLQIIPRNKLSDLFTLVFLLKKNRNPASRQNSVISSPNIKKGGC